MNKVLVIARREFTEVLRMKIFWISTLLPIVIMIAAMRLSGEHSRPNPDEARFLGAFMYVLVMFMSIMPTSGMLLTSLIEEKSSRVIEVLLSAVSPFQLMTGKILGLICVGLTSGAIFAVVLSVAGGGTGMVIAPSATLLALFVIYYLLGFVMYASIFAAAGAACNTIKDAQTIMIPISFLLMLPFFLSPKIAAHPTSGYAVALSLFPPTAPTVMILRIAVLPTPPWVEIAISLLLLAAAVPCTVWAAAKIFRTGVLLYGKPPKLGEILRWVRNG